MDIIVSKYLLQFRQANDVICRNAGDHAVNHNLRKNFVIPNL